MPPSFFVPPEEIDTNNIVVTQEEIYRVNPHRYEFMLLDALVRMDHENGISIGYHDARDDEFWVRGHIPGRPLFPGILMLETAAHLISYHAKTHLNEERFIGFGAVNNVRFRGIVKPGDRFIVVSKAKQIKPGRCVFDAQGIVDGQLVFEATITGLRV